MGNKNRYKMKKEPFGKKVKAWFKNIRYQKFVTTFLYLLLFAIIVYTFWEYNFVGAEVGAEVYSKTLDTLLGLLCTTTSLKLGEVAGQTFENVTRIKNAMKHDQEDSASVTDDMRGGE